MESHKMGPKGLRKVVEVCQIIAARNGTSVRELGSILNMPKSTAHRLVSALAAAGLIQRNGTRDRYILGALINELAGGPIAWRSLVARYHHRMVALRDRTRETISLHVLYAERRVLIEQIESQEEHRWVFRNPLVPMPLHAGAAAKMLLSQLPNAQVEKLLKRDGMERFTDYTPRSVPLLLQDLKRVRARGYAISMQEVSQGIASVAIPLPSSDSIPLCAVLSLTGPSVRLSEKALKRLVPLLRETVNVD